MLNKLKRFIGSNEPVQQKSEEIEKQQYIQYAQEVEQILSKLEAGVHESDDPSWIMQSVMKTALDFYKGDWIGFLEVDLELGLWTPTHWYNSSPNDKTFDLLQEFESAEFLHRWVAAMNNNTAIVVSDMEEVRDQFPGEYAVYQRLMAKSVLAVPVKPRPMGFLVIRNPQRYLNRSSMLQLLAFVVLACVNEQKLMQSMKMSFSPESIENDADIIINLFGDLEIYTSSGVLREGDLKSPTNTIHIPYNQIIDVKYVPGSVLNGFICTIRKDDSIPANVFQAVKHNCSVVFRLTKNKQALHFVSLIKSKLNL